MRELNLVVGFLIPKAERELLAYVAFFVWPEKALQFFHAGRLSFGSKLKVEFTGLQSECWLQCSFQTGISIRRKDWGHGFISVLLTVMSQGSAQCLVHSRYWIHSCLIKMVHSGLPWWRSGWESACQCRGHGFEPWSGRIPHAAEQLGPWATTTEPARLEPVLPTREAAIVRGPPTAMKSGPRLPQLEKALAQKRRPNTPKNK